MPFSLHLPAHQAPSPYAVWAPLPESVRLFAGGASYPMQRRDDGWWQVGGDLPVELLRADVDYGYLLDDDPTPLPDPRSRRQPDGVHALSRTYDPSSFDRHDADWTGRQLAGSVIYELHVGTFTPQGTLSAAVGKLDHLVALGIDFVELMPVNGFNGPHGWGYDGVCWFAVHEPYGGPAAYQEFVDACHTRGIGVIQDVVYNHFGPSGNYLPRFGPYLNDAISSPWGSAINLDGEDSDAVRDYIVANALMWLRDYHVDGLRLDAVHALVDSRAMHILEEIATEVDALSAFLKRPLTLIAESDLNDPRIITPREAGGYGIDAQWSDDFHHALLANLTGDDSGYYADFASLDALAKVVETGFFHDGTKSSFRGRRHGRRLDVPKTPTWRLVVCSDNHDQIGNRAAGERLSQTQGPDQLALAAVLTMLSACTPMVFMGEEWGASTPWMFFSSHPEDDLAAAVSAGRFEEFAKTGWDTAAVPDPQAEATFTGSRLRWDEVADDPHARLLTLYRDLIALRHTYPDLTDPRFDWVSAQYEPDQRWFCLQRGARISVLVNFGTEPAQAPVEGSSDVLLSVGDVALEDASVRLGGHAAVVLQLQEDPFAAT